MEISQLYPNYFQANNHKKIQKINFKDSCQLGQFFLIEKMVEKTTYC